MYVNIYECGKSLYSKDTINNNNYSWFSYTVVSRAIAHGRSYFNVDFHRTGRLPCVKIEVGGVNALACVHACYVA